MDNNRSKSILKEIEKRLDHENFITWFNLVKFEIPDDKSVNTIVPNEYFKNWIEEHYTTLINEILKDLNFSNYQLNFSLGDTKSNNEGSQPIESTEITSKQQFTLKEEHQNKNLITSIVETDPIEVTLNPKYTFDTFVVGSCNQFAHAAAQAVADSPFRTYNPLFMYGGVGLGKTHLMHAIGQAVISRNNHLKLAYISSEKFMNELINAIRYDKTQVFREKYRSIDVLLVDDIQFIAGKERTQEEFFHTFNALYDAQKQIVISSDCPPKEIPTLEERLHSRFEWGLIADLQPPDLETKVAILKRKAEAEKIDLSDEIAFFIAGKIKSNIRELEGSLIRLVAYASLEEKSIDIELCKTVLNIENTDEKERIITVETIQRVVANHYGLHYTDLKSKNNSQNIALPRQVAMYLCKQLTPYSFPEIGREFGNKHHTTVLHSCSKITELYNTNKDFHRFIHSLIDLFK